MVVLGGGNGLSTEIYERDVYNLIGWNPVIAGWDPVIAVHHCPVILYEWNHSYAQQR